MDRQSQNKILYTLGLVICLIPLCIGQQVQFSASDCVYDFVPGASPQWTAASGNIAQVGRALSAIGTTAPLFCFTPLTGAADNLLTKAVFTLNRATQTIGDKTKMFDIVVFGISSNADGPQKLVNNFTNSASGTKDMMQEVVIYEFDGYSLANSLGTHLAVGISIQNLGSFTFTTLLRALSVDLTYQTPNAPAVPSAQPLNATGEPDIPLIVGLSVSLPIAAAGAVVLIVLLLRRKKNKKSSGSTQKMHNDVHSTPMQQTSAPTIYTGVNVADNTANPSYQALSPNNMTVNLDDRFAIPWSKLVFKQEIGSGAFGKVYLGTWQSTQVAIKVSNSIGATEEFQKEARIMVNIRPHPNVLQVLGVSLDGQSPAIILEYCPGRSLDEMLFDHSKRITPAYQYRLIFGIAKGLFHLHLNNIVHRDVAARNILLSGDGEAKISDFGMSRIVESSIQEGTTKTNIGPIRWMAPEAIRNRKYSAKSDVWSFGVVMTEILNREQPFNDVAEVLEVALELKNNKSPKIPQDCPEVYKNIMRMCFQADPNARPEMEQICAMLDKYRP